MALQIYLEPDVWSAVYRPIIWHFFTDIYPNGTVRESNLLINEIRRPTPAELITYPQLTKASVLVDHQYIDPTVFYDGASIEIYGATTYGYYDGVHVVAERISGTLTLIETADGWVGDDFGGVFRVHYTNFTVFAEVLSENMTEPVKFELKPTRDQDGTIVFAMDCRDALARFFKDVKRIINPDNDADTDAFIAADGYITQRYTVTAYEGYDIVDEYGNTTFTKFKDGAVTSTEYMAVNAVQPYHEMRRDGDVRLDWNDGLTDYVLSNTAGLDKRLLTHASTSSQFVTANDPHYMAFLWGGTQYTNLKFKVSYYTGKDGGGTFISSSTYRGNAPGKSCIMPMGPAAITVPANAKSYKFAVFTDNENILTEIFTFNIRPCQGAGTRFFYLNKLGGVDAFTFQGDEDRTLNVGRELTSKPHMNTLPGFFNGDYQRRVWRTTVDRRYTITSGYLLPEQIRSVVEPMFESANVWTNIHPDWWTDVVIFTGATPADSTSEQAQRMVIEYGLGVDNVSQRT